MIGPDEGLRFPDAPCEHHVLCEDCGTHCAVCGMEAPEGLEMTAVMAMLDEHPSILFATMAAALFSTGMRGRDNRALVLAAMAFNTGLSLQRLGQ